MSEDIRVRRTDGEDYGAGRGDRAGNGPRPPPPRSGTGGGNAERHCQERRSTPLTSRPSRIARAPARAPLGACLSHRATPRRVFEPRARAGGGARKGPQDQDRPTTRSPRAIWQRRWRWNEAKAPVISPAGREAGRRGPKRPTRAPMPHHKQQASQRGSENRRRRAAKSPGTIYCPKALAHGSLRQSADHESHDRRARSASRRRGDAERRRHTGAKRASWGSPPEPNLLRRLWKVSTNTVVGRTIRCSAPPPCLEVRDARCRQACQTPPNRPPRHADISGVPGHHREPSARPFSATAPTTTDALASAPSGARRRMQLSSSKWPRHTAESSA